MKKILKKLMIMFIVLTSAQSIAQLDSTRINLTIQNKLEVVKTLTAYPLLLDNIYLKDNLLATSKELNSNLRLQINNSVNEISNLELQIKSLKEEKELFKKQLQKQKVKSLKIGGVGVLVIATILLVN